MIDDSALIKHEFGDWTIIERDVEKTKAYNRITYKCKCKCGNIQSVAYHDLKSGRSRACKQCATSGTNNHAFIDKSGLILGKFSILQYDHTENNMSYWLCKDVTTGKIEVKSDNNLQVIKYRLRKESEKRKQLGLNGYDSYLQYIENYGKKPKIKVPFTFIDKERR